ncbi:MAG TPA: hypothetical protein VFX59_25165 [Polyangiales bacterium]|nr:hypothetical protein [Polyangiales bacterium]
MDEREKRARHRRATWHGEVVQTGQPRAGLYTDLSPAQRLAALIELNERAWLATGSPLPAPLPRAEWPGEVFECARARRG